MPELKAMGMLNAKRGMVNIFGDTLSEVEIDTLVDTLVEKQARMQVKSLKNTLTKKKETGATQHTGCLAIRSVS